MLRDRGASRHSSGCCKELQGEADCHESTITSQQQDSTKAGGALRYKFRNKVTVRCPYKFEPWSKSDEYI